MLINAALSLAVATVALACVTGCSSGSSSGTERPAVVNVPGKLTVQQVRVLAQGITAPTVTSEAAIIATDVRAQFIKNGRILLPAGSSLRIDAASFRQTNAETATVTAIVSGPAAGRWQLMLVRESGQWLLIGTRRLP